MLKLFKAGVIALASFNLFGCSDASIANHNISSASDNFEVPRRVIFYNGITDQYILSVEGYCSVEVGHGGNMFYVICKTGPKAYKRHQLVLSDNVSAFVEQLEPASVDVDHYRVVFRPSAIVPDVVVK